MKLFRDRANQLGDDFVLKEFMDEFYDSGSIPMSLIRWEMTGYDDEIEKLWQPTDTSIISGIELGITNTWGYSDEFPATTTSFGPFDYSPGTWGFELSVGVQREGKVDGASFSISKGTVWTTDQIVTER